MFACCHSTIFFVIRSESRAPCQKEVKKRLPVKVHRWRSQKPMVPGKAKPVNLVLRSPWSAREYLPQDLGYAVNPVNVDELQVDHIRTRRFVRAATPRTERNFDAADASTPSPLSSTLPAIFSAVNLNAFPLYLHALDQDFDVARVRLNGNPLPWPPSCTLTCFSCLLSSPIIVILMQYLLLNASNHLRFSGDPDDTKSSP